MSDEVLDAVEAWFKEIAKHEPHTWEQVGRCVYCADCAIRLYQGSIPPSHARVAGRRARAGPKSTQEMRAHWGKDD